MFRWGTALLVSALGASTAVAAEAPKSRPLAVNAAVLASLHPGGETLSPPYVFDGFGGTVPGALLSVQLQLPRGPLFAAEAASTLPLRRNPERGRIHGPDTYRDSTACLLLGYALPADGGSIEPKAGIGLANHGSAVVAGFDIVSRGRRVTVLFAARYLRMLGHEYAEDFGAARNVFRAGFGVRLR